MKRVVVIHWNAEEAEPELKRLRKGDAYDVLHLDKTGTAELKSIGKSPPDAIIIDLSRLPSHGRAVAVFLRQQKATRYVPIVFADGTATNIARAKRELPDATSAQWRTIRSALRSAIKNAPTSPHVPGTMDAYSTTPLARKLGIKTEQTIMLLGAPPGFVKLLRPLSSSVKVKKSASGKGDVLILFVKSLGQYSAKLPVAKRALADGGRLWIAWPKQASGIKTDVNGNIVREKGLTSGLVDYKICAIDDTWSGLCFARRK